jgi:nitrite reductase (NADH) large subunit
VHSVWYEDHRVTIVRRDPVVAIDREGKRVRTESGRVQTYDHLVLATGASPVIAKIPGMDGRDVRALRTLDDARHIGERARAAKREGLPVVIIGGGLLGIELADELNKLGIAVRVLESADYPLSRQLEKSAGSLLAERLRLAGLVVTPRVRVTRIEEQEVGSLVHVEGQEPIPAGFVVPAMGIRPRDQLAREAGLLCDLFGGVEVDDNLLTSDPTISAVGECARHRGMTYGLVAPGYAMAETVARRLAGGEAKFEGVQTGTRLKVSSVELTVVGESNATGLGLREYTFEADGTYRRLALKRGRVIGITAVGPWKDLPRAQEAMARAEKLKPRQMLRFERDEAMWSSGRLSLRTWPDSATVCTCMGVTCGALKRAQREGCANVEAFAEVTGASTVCGSCRPLIATLVEDQPTEIEQDSVWLLGFSVVAAMGALAFCFIPEIPYSNTVQSESIDVLWRNPDYKRLTGFSLVGLFSLSVLFSLRKRWKKLSFGDFEAWRVTHAAVGVLCLVGGFVHTGFRLGSRLDFALALTFLGSVFLGGLAGGWSLLEERVSPEQARALRGILIKSHIYFLWPLPVLLAVHVAKAYFF